MAAAAILKSV